MKRMLWTRAVVPLATASAALAVASPALAANCDTLPGPLYITGSSAAKPFIAGLGTALAGTTTLVYSSPGSCNGVDAIFNGTLMTGTATYWDSTGTAQMCTINPVGGVTVDVGISDVFSSSCAGFGAPPAGTADFFGPHQVMNFVVPTASSQTLISAEAAYFAFGFGMNGMAAPWTNETFIFQRGAASGTQSMLAAAIAVPPTKWKGVTVANGSAGMFTSVSTSTSPEATIGILASDVADGSTKDPTTMALVPNRSKIKILAYQHFKQDCGWLPDSSSTAYDKKNVRDGHYPLWGPLHFFAKVDGTNTPTNAAAAKFIGYFTGKVATPAAVNLLQLEIQNHTVPSCAMHVQRSAEVGPVSSFKAASSCDCYFDFTATGATTCKTCAAAADCTGNTTCTMYGTSGYCEAK